MTDQKQFENLERLKELVDRFRINLADYKSSRYDEENTKIDFIDKFFELLDWDLYNKQGYSEDFREVVREDKVYYRKQVISPDYSFKIGKERQFFVEAKKPSVNIYEGISEAYQIKRYAFTAGIPVSILTDFEEFAIYDTRQAPKPTDSPATARIFYCTFTDYEKNWEYLYNTFSKTAVLKGNLKRYVEDNKVKKGTQTIDKAMLQTIDKWREELAKNIALRNKGIDIYMLNEAVQKIIDRIIFLRIAEDRKTEIERYLEILTESPNIYSNLTKYFFVANNKYNSGLFAPVHWLDNLALDDKTLKSIIRDIYYPSPYEFSALPIEILGQIYEQFLGKTIRLTAGGQAKIEEKPEVRKAGGVYYTPQYIVDYIVENTVGKLIENKAPKDIEHITVLDPACGSGSFLVRAYDYLLNYHLRWFSQEQNRERAIRDGKIYRDAHESYRLTIRAKKKILLDNIYGVDIDSQAVEVTRLSLLLKLMEGEIVESRNELFLKSQTEALLPNLDNNIKCGNSLIGTDFYKDKDMQLFGTDEQKKINCFDWEVQFKEIMKSGGFDCVIGNPPYVNLVAIPVVQRNYFQLKFKTCKNKSDLYSFFIEKACELLKNMVGKFSYIVPHTWLATESFELLRKKLLIESRIENITEMGFKVFDGVTVSTVILVCSFKNETITVINKDFTKRFSIPKSKWVDDNYHIDLEWTFEKETIYKKISNDKIPLEKIIQFSRGIKTSDDNRFIHTVKTNHEYKPVYRGRNIKAYSLKWEGEYIWYRPDLMKEKVGCLPHNKEFFEVPEKLITQRVNSSMKLLVAHDNSQNYFLDTTNVSRYETWDRKHSFYFILGILNSKLINYWYCNKYKMPTIGLYELHSIPFKQIDFSNPKEKAKHDRMVSLVEQMLEAQKEAHSGKIITETDKKLAQQRIEILDRQIDALVYELYGLTPEEIKIVEGEG